MQGSNMPGWESNRKYWAKILISSTPPYHLPVLGWHRYLAGNKRKLFNMKTFFKKNYLSSKNREIWLTFHRIFGKLLAEKLQIWESQAEEELYKISKTDYSSNWMNQLTHVECDCDNIERHGGLCDCAERWTLETKTFNSWTDGLRRIKTELSVVNGPKKGNRALFVGNIPTPSAYLILESRTPFSQGIHALYS